MCSDKENPKESGEESANSSSSSSSSSEGDEWGSVRDGFNIDLASSSEEEESGLFIPDPVIQLNHECDKPALLYLSKDELPVGVTVWVLDEEDVECLLHPYWGSTYKHVCNGRLKGILKRHIGEMSFVLFHDDKTEVDFGLTLPRCCLTKNAVEPYESRHVATNVRVLGSFYCNVGPRASGHCPASAARSPRTASQQLYEQLSVLSISSESLPFIGRAHERFLKGAFEEALREVNTVLAAQGGTPIYLDALLLRSRILVFLEQYDKALIDAKQCIALEPEWIRGLLCAARAYCGLGNFEEAGVCIETASKFVHSSTEVRELEAMNAYLYGLQQRLVNSGSSVTLFLDHMYRKCFLVKQNCKSGDVLCREGRPIIAMVSIFGVAPPGRCSVCFRAGAETMEFVSSYRSHPYLSSVNNGSSGSEVCTMSSDANQALFCSRGCQLRASLYAPMETKHREGVSRARDLIKSKMSITIDHYPLEMANMTLRLFFMVISTHRRLSAQRKRTLRGDGLHTIGRDHADPPTTRITVLDSQDPDWTNASSSPAAYIPPPKLSIILALKHLGLYPLVSVHFSNRTHEELSVLYEALTVNFKEESKKVYSKTLFESLYTYVHAHIMPVELDPLPESLCSSVRSSNHQLETLVNRASASKKQKVFYLPFVVGCSGRATAPTILSRAKNIAAVAVCNDKECTIPDRVLFPSDRVLLYHSATEPPRTTKRTCNALVRQVQSVSPDLVSSPPPRQLPRVITDTCDSADSPLLELVVTESLHPMDRVVFPPFTLDLKEWL